LLEQLARRHFLDDDRHRLVGDVTGSGQWRARIGGDLLDQLAEGDLQLGVGDGLVEGGDVGQDRPRLRRRRCAETGRQCKDE
jgi:hypothetical protein